MLKLKYSKNVGRINIKICDQANLDLFDELKIFYSIYFIV